MRTTLTVLQLFFLSSAITAEEPSEARPIKDPVELKYWLQNMAWHHHYTLDEMSIVLGMEKAQVQTAMKKHNVTFENAPPLKKNVPLRVLPYPGGRHPRIGFLEGAIRPQRETKVSIFTPWDPKSYVVADVPEAIWSNLGLTYLAHTHVDTVWTKTNVILKRLEWKRLDDGTFSMERRLPNGIVFGTRIIPKKDGVLMRQWLKNGTEKKLTGLRVQNCVMLKAAKGFEAQTNDNKVLQKEYAACHDENRKRWIITAWKPVHRTWANPRCPCLHSDPKFADCEPGKTQHLTGWVSFYEGKDIQGEIQRLEKTRWWATK